MPRTTLDHLAESETGLTRYCGLIGQVKISTNQVAKSGQAGFVFGLMDQGLNVSVERRSHQFLLALSSSYKHRVCSCVGIMASFV
jgi:hypothetical protein